MLFGEIKVISLGSALLGQCRVINVEKKKNVV